MRRIAFYDDGFVSMKIQRKVPSTSFFARNTKFLPKIIVSAQLGSRVQTFVTFFHRPAAADFNEKRGKEIFEEHATLDQSFFLEQQAFNIYLHS